MFAGAEVWHLSCERYLAQMKSGGAPQRDQSSSSPAIGRDAAVQRNGDGGVSASSGKVAANGEAKKELQSKVSTISSKFESSKSSDAALGKFARSDSREPLSINVTVPYTVTLCPTNAVP